VAECEDCLLQTLRTRPEQTEENHQVLGRVRAAVKEVEEADDLRELPSLKKLSGGGGDHYRIRVGDYRIGIALEGETVAFVRCLHRKDSYRYFP
jgi:mRNA interferase RelE/StbE